MASEIEQAFAAVRSGNSSELSRMITENPALASSKDDKGVSLILFASYHRQADIVQLLRGVVERLDIFEALALDGTSARVAELLDASPALAGSYSGDGFTPLHLAAYFGNAGAARLLLDRGADPDAGSRNAMALRPIHSAAVSRSLEIVKMLVDRGAQVNARQHGGWTPLHAAAFIGDLAMVEYLVTHGADIALASDDGKTALEMALEKGHAAVAEWLRVGATS
jgi:ankyrin repeat protein